MTKSTKARAAYARARNFTHNDVRNFYQEPCLEGFEHVVEATDDATDPIWRYLWVDKHRPTRSIK